MNQASRYGVVLKSGKVVRQAALDQYATKSKELPDPFGGSYSQGLVEPKYNPLALSQLLEINTYHYRAAKVKARDTAGLGWELAAVGDHADDADRDRLAEFFENQDDPLPVLLDRCQLDYEAIGWATLELIRQDHNPRAPFTKMNHIPAHTMRIHKDRNKFAQQRGSSTQKRWFKRANYPYDVHIDTGTEHALGSLPADHRATEILFWHNYTPRSDYYGFPDVMPAMGAILGEVSRRDYNIAFFDNFGVPAYAVFVTGDFDPGEEDEDGRTELDHAIESHFQDLAQNPHSTLILTIPSTGSGGQEVKVHFQPLSTEIKEASFRLFRQDNRDEVLAAHGVPPYRAGIAETGSLGGSTAAESTEIYKRSVIEPRQVIIEHMITQQVIKLGFGIERWRFKLSEIDLTDERHEMDLLKDLVETGAISPEEMRGHWAERFGLADEPVLGEAEFDPGLDEPDLEAVDRAIASFRDAAIKRARRNRRVAS